MKTTKRSTIYFDPDLHRALQLKSVETSQSISDLVNHAVREIFTEDDEDLAAIEEREKEPLISYSDMLKKLRKNGKI